MRRRQNPARPLAIALASITLLAAPAALSGCETIQSYGGDIVERITSEWALDSLANVDLEQAIADGAQRPTLTITDDGALGGSTGLNRYTGALDLESLLQGAFETGPLATTKMAGPPAAVNLENAFLSALQSVTGFQLDGDTLALLDQAGSQLMSFVRGG